ncbi:MAG: hypothetical protein ACPG49_03960 [Chitinophagales bacterium]
MVLSRKKIDQLSQQKYAEAIQKYEARKVDYDTKILQYQKNLKLYEKALVKKQELEKERTNVIIQNIAIVDIFGDKINSYRKYTKSILNVNHLKKHIQKNGLRGKAPKTIYTLFDLKTKPRKNFLIGEALIAENLGITIHEAKYHFDKRYEQYRSEYINILNQIKKSTPSPGYLVSLERMLNTLDEKYIEKKVEMDLVSDSEYSNYFTASVSQMGWINIDRWLKDKETQEVFVIADKDENTRFFAISHTFNSCFGSWQANGEKSISIDLPVGEEFTIIGLKVENGKFKMANKNFEVPQKDLKIPMNFEEKSLAYLKQKVRSLEALRPI